MDRFIVKSEQGAQAVFHSRQYDQSAWLKAYTVDLQVHDFRASVQVENPGSGHPPSQLFSELAAQWAGWQGPRDWCAMEGELAIAATCDAIGHIKLDFSIPGYGESLGWSACLCVTVEAGQLEQLAQEAIAFFTASP